MPAEAMSLEDGMQASSLPSALWETAAMTPPPPQILAREFDRRFGGAPGFVVRAPGRVNLIGEHTDYNEGFVLPMAIDRHVLVAGRARSDRRVVLRSMNFNEESTFDLDTPGDRGRAWIDYAKGMAWALRAAGCRLTGFEGVVWGDVPEGAGLSSSAALEMAVARSFAVASDLDWDAAAMARAGQQAEQEWVGVHCGIMDQLISAAGRAGHAQLIDCRSLEMTATPLQASIAIVVLDTSTRRRLAGSEYNERRAQCAAAAAAGGVASLRDLSLARLADCRGLIGDAAFRRARHVITENARTLAAAEAMRQGNGESLGRLMTESHVSLRDDFEVSTPALDAMVEGALLSPACLGARLTGAGFGGCAVAAVRRDGVEGFIEHACSRFGAVTGLAPKAYVCEAVNGAEVLEP